MSMKIERGKESRVIVSEDVLGSDRSGYEFVFLSFLMGVAEGMLTIVEGRR